MQRAPVSLEERFRGVGKETGVQREGAEEGRQMEQRHPATGEGEESRSTGRVERRLGDTTLEGRGEKGGILGGR